MHITFSPRSHFVSRRARISGLAGVGLLACSLLSGCADIDPAPSDVDGLVHWFWNNYADATDADIATAVGNLHATAGAALDPQDPRNGGITDLTTEELMPVEMQDRADPAAARGIYIITSIPCSLDQIEKLIYAQNQNELYPDVYESYQRTYTSDLAAYEARTAPTLTWNTEIGAKILGNAYRETLHGGLRNATFTVPPEGTTIPRALVSRTWMPNPAVFEDTDKSWDQDYQIELYYPRGENETIHVYGLWRQMDLGTILGLDTENEEMVRVMLDNLVEWDEHTGEICNPPAQ